MIRTIAFYGALAVAFAGLCVFGVVMLGTGGAG